MSTVVVRARVALCSLTTFATLALVAAIGVERSIRW